MFCENCGHELEDNAEICTYCGTRPSKKPSGKPGEMCALAIVGFALSFFISIAGLICSVIAYRKCRDENLDGKGFAIAGIIIGSLSLAIFLIFLISMFTYFFGFIACFAYALSKI